MVATKHDMKELERTARRQGWTVKQTGSNHLRWTPPHGRAVLTSLTPSNNYAINMIERDLTRAGLRLGVEYVKKEKPVASVADLIKANGTGETIVTPKPEPERATRVYRPGLENDILVALKGAFPKEVDKTTLMMKVSLNNPGLKENNLYGKLAKLKNTGKILNTRMGFYKAASADVALDTDAPTPRVPLEPVLAGEAKAVIDALLVAAANAEKLLVRLTRQQAEQAEATELIKRMAAKL